MPAKKPDKELQRKTSFLILVSTAQEYPASLEEKLCWCDRILEGFVGELHTVVKLDYMRNVCINVVDLVAHVICMIGLSIMDFTGGSCHEIDSRIVFDETRRRGGRLVSKNIEGFLCR